MSASTSAPRARSASFYDPAGIDYGLPTYPWRWAPKGLLTVRQLRAAGLRPGGQDPVAQILWRRGRRVAYLYRADRALPKRTATPAQLAAIGRALTARRTCQTCGQVRHYFMPRSRGECNDCADGLRAEETAACSRLVCTAHAVRVLPGVPAAVPQARAMVREVLGSEHPAAASAALAVSELVTNSLTHSRSGLPGGTVSVSVSVSAAWVLVTVTDAGAVTVPAVASPAPGAEHGRGLGIVAALAGSWGTAAAPYGLAVWCRLPADGGADPPAGAPNAGVCVREHTHARAHARAAASGGAR